MQSPTSRKIRIAALCAGAGLTLSGFLWWSQSSAATPSILPAGSFRLDVKNLVVSDPSLVVTQVSVEKAGEAAIQVKGNGFDFGTATHSASQPDKGLRQAETILVADLTTHKNKANNTFKLLLQSSGGVAENCYSGIWPTPKAAKVSDVLAVTIQPGIYRLGTDLRLGTLQGKPITFTVR